MVVELTREPFPAIQRDRPSRFSTGLVFGEPNHETNRNPARAFSNSKRKFHYLNLPSQSISRSYGPSLPTSLTYIMQIDQSLLSLRTCCGYWNGLTGNLVGRSRLRSRQFSGQKSKALDRTEGARLFQISECFA